MAAGWLRGSHFHATAGGVAWFTGAVLAFTVFMYGLAEILANRIPTQEEYVGLTPVVAILPWFIAGSLFPITALPAWLAWVARALPTTHVLALLRYGVLDHTGAGLHDIWGMTSTTTDAALSLLVLAGWAILITAARHPRLHPLGGELTRTQPPEPARRAHAWARRAAPIAPQCTRQAGVPALGSPYTGEQAGRMPQDTTAQNIPIWLLLRTIAPTGIRSEQQIRERQAVGRLNHERHSETVVPHDGCRFRVALG